MAEGLLHHHSCRVGQTRSGQALDHHAEQRGRDLEVEHRAARISDGAGDALVGVVVAEVAGQIGQPRGEAVEYLVVDCLTAIRDALARVVAELRDRPVVARDPHDRAVDQATALQAVERVKGHHLGEVSGDAEDDEHVRGRRAVRVARARAGPLARSYRGAHACLSLRVRGASASVILRRRPRWRITLFG